MDIKEKRSAGRIPMRQAIELDMGRERWFEAQGMNISIGGVLLETWQPVEELAQVELVFELPSGSSTVTISVQGIVRHVSRKKKSWFAGVEFFGLEPEQIEAIKNYREDYI